MSNTIPAFICPSCSGSHFGRDVVRGSDGQPLVLDTVQCHDEFAKGCNWRGVFVGVAADELTQLRAENARLQAAHKQMQQKIDELESRELNVNDIADYTESIQRLQTRVNELEGLLRELQAEIAWRLPAHKKIAEIINAKIDAALGKEGT